eukprot:s871_g4.t1
MSLADSEAAFEQHCNKLLADGSLHTLLVQTPPTDEQFKDFATRLNSGVEMTFGLQSALRRLHFEASAIIMAELKTRATDTSGDGARKLPIAEKAARLKDQETRLPGLRIKGELQPSYALVDMVSQIKETNSVTWIPPSKCSKRDAEIQNIQKDKPVTLSLEQQMVKLTSSEEPLQVDTSTDLQLQWALQRRGLAFDQCSLISQVEHEIWVQQLLCHLTREAPMGFSRISTSQLIRADRELFTLMAQELQGSLQPTGSGEFPMEKKLKELRTDPRVTMFLLPLPRGTPKEQDKSTATSSTTPAPKAATARPTKRIKTASAKARALCPQELKGYAQKDANGAAICWAYNLKGGCKNEVTQGREKPEMSVTRNFLKRKLEHAKDSFSKKSKNSSKEDQCHVQGPPTAAAETGTQKTMEQVQTAPVVLSEESATVSQNSGKFMDFKISNLLIIEIFAGTARLSKVARDVGFQVLPVDKTAARASQIFVAQYDITQPDEMASLVELIRKEADRIAAIHLAPACGTASRAREKKFTKLAKQGFKIPGPLRSQTKPMGLDGLSGLDKVRTESANLVYSATATLVQLCITLDILCSVENPQNSLFWMFPEIAELLQRYGGHHVVFDNCMHGGHRQKATTWWATQDVYNELAVRCDGSHEHAKWNPTPHGRNLSFPTAQEAAYPILLCKRVIAIIYKYAISQGATDPDSLTEQLPSTNTTSHRWVLDMLPRGKKLRPLVSEFQCYVNFLHQVAQDPEQSPFLQLLPKGARVVHRRIEWGKVRVEVHNGNLEFFWETKLRTYKLDPRSPLLERDANNSELHAEFCTAGIPREPWDFVQKAVEVGHPRTLAVHLNEEVIHMLKQNFSGEPYHLVKERAVFLNKWVKRCKELEPDERAHHEKLQPHLKHVLEGKRLLLMGEILADLGYPDEHLVEHISAGFKLTGWLPESGVFPLSTKRPSHSLGAAHRFAKGVNHSICRQVGSNNNDKLDAEVWRQTLEEVDKGWAWIDENCDPSSKLLAKRFGLEQTDKIRLIDDCTIGGYNGTCGSKERLRVHSVDEMAAYITWCLTHLDQSAMREVEGKTYDLKNAYKQYGVSAEDRDLLRLAVWDAENKRIRFLGINALPFGAVGSVSAFLRVAMAIWFIGVKGLKLCWTCFFDDYTLLSKKTTAFSASTVAEGLFSLLGIKFAQDGKKAVPWGTLVKTLGVVIDLAPTGEEGKVVTLGHTESRVRELSLLIEGFLKEKKMSQKDAERLRGRLQWFESFAHGRVAQQALRTVSSIASTGRKQNLLTIYEMRALKFLLERVLSAPPTRIQSTCLQTWIVFTDGACEGEDEKVGTIGAVLISPCGVPCSFISETVPSYWMDHFMQNSKHPIFELELLPVFCALITWEQHLKHTQCIFYLDNEAAKGALVTGATSTPAGRQMIQAFVLKEMECQVKIWFSRVPTSSNVADDPSRLVTDELYALGVSRVTCDWKSLWKRIEEMGSEDWGFKDGIPEFSPMSLE